MFSLFKIANPIDFRALPREQLLGKKIDIRNLLTNKKDLETLKPEEIKILKTEIPIISKNKTISEILIELKLSKSKGEAKRLIAANSISFNGVKVLEDIKISQSGLLKKGKNSFILVD